MADRPPEQPGEAPDQARSALEALLARKWPALERFVRRKVSATVSERESADDIVQSVCREVIDRARDGRFEFRGEKEVEHFLFEAAELKLGARHRYWTTQRRDAARDAPQRSEETPLEPLERSEAGPSRLMAAKEDVERLRAAIERLPERYRDVLRLAQIEGRTHAEIAQQLGISEVNSRALLARAVAKLSTEIGEDTSGA